VTGAEGGTYQRKGIEGLLGRRYHGRLFIRVGVVVSIVAVELLGLGEPLESTRGHGSDAMMQQR